MYDTTNKKLVHLQPIPSDIQFPNDTNFLGPYMESNIAQQIAEAIIDPKQILTPQTLPFIKKTSIIIINIIITTK